MLLDIVQILIKPVIYIIAICIFLQLFAKLTSAWCKSNVYLEGKTALITGGSTGLGYYTALGLAARGCRVIIAHRNEIPGLREDIIEKTGNNNIVIKHFDLASLESVRKLAKDINENEERLDILINNAGVMGLKNSYSEDGLHKTMQINHFGGFLLTHLLIGLLKKSAPSRIIFVSSVAAFRNNVTPENINRPFKVGSAFSKEGVIYGNTKLCNIITSNVLSKKLEGTGIVANSIHPGMVKTAFHQKLCVNFNMGKFSQFLLYCIKYFAKTPQEGVQTILHVAMSKELEKVSGKYFVECRSFLQPSKAKNQEFCEKIWKASEVLVKLAPKERLV